MPDGTNILIEENGTLIVLILNSKQTVTSGQDPTHSLLVYFFKCNLYNLYKKIK